MFLLLCCTGERYCVLLVYVTVCYWCMLLCVTGVCYCVLLVYVTVCYWCMLLCVTGVCYSVLLVYVTVLLKYVTGVWYGGIYIKESFLRHHPSFGGGGVRWRRVCVNQEDLFRADMSQ